MKIILIAGKARSGKNTVANIIKETLNNKKVINLEYSSYMKKYAENIIDWDGSENTKPRDLLQQLGDEIKSFDPLFLIKEMIMDIDIYSMYFDIITISDVRFPNEIDEIKKKFENSISIRIERPNFDNGLTIEEKNHISEIALDNYNNFDYVIINDGDIDKLRNKIEEVIKNES